MRSVITIKPKEGIVPKNEKDNLEFAVEDVNGVLWSMFDRENSKIELEFDDEDEDFEITDVAIAIQNTAKFFVISIEGAIR